MPLFGIPVWLWAGAGAFALYEINEHAKNKALGGEENFDADALAGLTEMLPLIGGSPGQTARYFRNEVAGKLVQGLGFFGVEPVGSDVLAGTPFAPDKKNAAVFRLRPLAQVPGSPDAGTALVGALAKGMIGIASLAVAIPASRDDRLLVLAAPSSRKFCQPGTPWAVLADPAAMMGVGQPIANAGFPSGLPGGGMPAGGIQIPGGVMLPGGVVMPSGPPGGLPASVDPNLDPQSQATIAAMLADPTLTPEALDSAADALASAGFPMAAATLHAAANARRAARAAQEGIGGGMPFTIREGDIPSNLAQYYTGIANRWPELVTANPGKLQKGGEFGVTGWTVGKQIVIPLSWNPHAKPLPAPLVAGAVAGAGSTETPPARRRGAARKALST